MKTFNTLFARFFLLVACLIINYSSSAQSWSPLGSGVIGSVFTTAEYNGELFVGGLFTKAGDIDASNIAKWDGRKWTNVAFGFNNSVISLCVYNNELYAGGNFTKSGSDSINHIAVWNGTTWIPLGKGINGRVSAMVVFNNELYAAGQFDKAGDVATSNIAKWNGKTWSVVGSAIAKWENNSWNVTGSGMNGRVTSLCVYDGNLYAGGRFTSVGITPANYIAKWDGSNWSALGQGVSINYTTVPFVNSLSVFNNELYITGFFSDADSVPVSNIARWNGNAFLPVGSGLEFLSTGENYGRAMIVYNGELYVGGVFNYAGSIPAKNIAKWNGKAWSSIEFMNNTIVNCFGEYKVSMITGGTFIGPLNESYKIISYCPYAKADFSTEPSFGKTQPLIVAFSNKSTGSKSLSYYWDFGDKTSSTDNNPTHSFNNYGNTPVVLFATSEEGCTSSKIKSVTIDTLPPSVPKIIEDKNVLSLENPKPNEKYQWFFNDDKISGANSSTYKASKTGTYSIIATNINGSSSDKISIVVVDNQRIAFENLDINNISARFNSEGSMFWDFHEPMYEVPKGSGKNTIYTGALWVGGYDKNKKLHIAAQTYRRNGTDFWSGPVMKTAKYSATQDSAWNKVWKVNKVDIEDFKANWQKIGYKIPTSIADWPGNGDVLSGQSRQIAPYFDINKNGIYDPKNGDYPLIKGDQALFFVFNDDRAMHTQTLSDKLGIEVLCLAYAYNAPKDSSLNNTIFLNYTITNRSKEVYDSVYVGVLTDFDIGNSDDDYIGCDPVLNTYFGYTGDDFDEGSYGYGKTSPAQGVTFLNETMTNFMYYNNTGVGSPITQDPVNSEDYYNYMRSIWKDKSHATYGGNGYGGKVPVNYLFLEWYGGWTESSAKNQIGDRRGLGSFGPFTLKSGDSKKLDIAYITARDYSENQLSVDLLKKRVAEITEFYKANIAGK